MGKGGKGIQFTPENIFKNLQVVQENRGKKVRIVETRPLLAVTLIQWVNRTRIAWSKSASLRNSSRSP